MTKKLLTENEVYIVNSSDYLKFVTINSTAEQRKKFMIGDIYINAAVCIKCRDYIRSKSLHDFVTCSCGAVSVDGGSYYSRRVGQSEDYISIIEEFIK